MDKTVCRNFNTPNGCRYGSKCRYKHIEMRKSYKSVLVGNIPTDEKTKSCINIPCKLYYSTRGCKYGDKCKFAHKIPDIFLIDIPLVIVKVTTYRGVDSMIEYTITFFSRNGSDLTRYLDSRHIDTDFGEYYGYNVSTLPVTAVRDIHGIQGFRIMECIIHTWENIMRFVREFPLIHEVFNGMINDVRSIIIKYYVSLMYKPYIIDDINYD